MNRTETEYRCNILRQDLKKWEAKFTACNDGRKAERVDIKADAEISQKYKEYSKLRIELSRSKAPQTPSKRSSSRKSAHHVRDVERTPEAQAQTITSTPMKRKHDADTADMLTQTAEFLSPQGPAFIGPTPQRDGIVLGLFDRLPAETPSKRRAVLFEVDANVLETPSRENNAPRSETSEEPRARGERTPLSTGKRFMFNQFVTPKKRKLCEEGTPSSSLRGLATPAFLRRDNGLSIIGDADEEDPRPAPWKRRGLGRSLSDMIQAMRREEEERLDDEADIMRELEEEEEEGECKLRKVPLPKKDSLPMVLVQDSQVAMPLGPDRAVGSDVEEEEEEALGLDGKPRKVWKKKGLKRQTKRVIMRPNAAKPKAVARVQAEDTSEDEDGFKLTEKKAPTSPNDEGLYHTDDESNCASDASHTPRPHKVQSKKDTETDTKSKKEGVVKTAARKIKATANANYRRLKIKSKGGNGGKGRFSRRR